MDSSNFLLCLLFFRFVFGDEERNCYFSSSHSDGISVKVFEYGPSDDILNSTTPRNNQVKCIKSSDYCFALWKEEPLLSNESTANIVIIAQGCWEASGKQECDSEACVAERRLSKALNTTNFCCCKGDYCNANMTHMYIDKVHVTAIPTYVPAYTTKQYWFLLLALASCFSFLVGVVSILIRYIHQNNIQNKKQQGSDSMHLMEGTNYYCLDNLKLNSLIGQGRYGSVWNGALGEQQVAVKLFSAHHKNYFFNERDIYCLPFMDHSSLLTYYGCDERINSDGNVEFLLLLSVAGNGTLVEYLRNNTLDWNTFCRMCLSIAKGLAHLHTDIQKGDKFKPCISHRDLNSRNILVKEDLSCALCDLGFATKINGSRYFFNGEEQHAETKSINDVGTLRYMCPEVLEGAVNLRDCETSLKQIDVYALGLVLWEIATRCTEFYPNGVECLPYKMPFEAEIGHHPTFEQMQVLVCKHKARPLFPNMWRDTAAMRSVKETIEDCWDQDAEARLTALCVEERFNELSGFTDRQKRIVCNSGISPSLIAKDSHNVFIIGYGDKTVDSCLSESTLDTLLTTSPTNPLINFKNSNQMQPYTPSVQPYQGRNPCLERNLMLNQDVNFKPVEFIDKSRKHSNLGESSFFVNDYINLITQNYANASHGNHLPNHFSDPVIRANTPIPFVQNVVFSDPVPKQLNIQTSNTSDRKPWNTFKKIVDFFKPEDNLKTNLLSETPESEKFETLVDICNGKTETKVNKYPITTTNAKLDISRELGKQNNKRPNTLPLKTNDYRLRSVVRNIEKKESQSVSEIEVELKCEKPKNNKNGNTKDNLDNRDIFTSDVKLKETSSRVKTPGDLPLAMRKHRVKKNATRFSLYDDRIMSGVYDNDILACHNNENNGKKYEVVYNSFEEINFTQNV